MCTRPNFEEEAKEVDDALKSTFDKWKSYSLMFVSEEDLGTKKEQIDSFIGDCKNRLDVLIGGV